MIALTRRATGVSRVLACCVGTPVVSHRCFTLPRSSILCGCINFPCRQVNAVWGRYPTACTMYITKKLGVCWGLVDKISPAFELRNSDVPVPAFVSGRRRGRNLQIPYKSRGSWPPHPSVVRRAGVVPIFSVTVLPALCCSSWAAVSSLYLPKTALAALAGLCPFSVTVLPSSPACPWVYSPKTAFATLANLQSEDLTL